MIRAELAVAAITLVPSFAQFANPQRRSFAILAMQPASTAQSTATLRLPTPSLLITATAAPNGKLRCALRSTRRWKGNGLL